MNQDTGITVYAFIRPGTPPSAGPAVVTQIVDLYRFGAIGPGSKVWCNLDIPNALWVLSDRSSYLRIVDVPTAGWVRLTKNSVAWGRVAIETSRNPSHCFHTNDMPIPLQPNDTVTVAFRNTDTNRMRSQFGGTNHAMNDFVAEHGSMRAIDLKMNTELKKRSLAAPTEFDINHAGIRGLDLMAATTGPAMHRVIRNNIDTFTTTILTDEFDDIQAAQKRITEITEMITDPIVDRISKLPDVGPFLADEPDIAELQTA